MRYLYIFPHPDDESFGPAAAMHHQLSQGHEVHLLTLTKGEATKQRHKLGYTKEEMGETRHQEMKCVEKVLGLTSMTVLDYPDNALAEEDPRTLEQTVQSYITKIQPNILVSYPVYGISGFNDHLVMHAVAKRAFLDLNDREGVDYLKRLAFYTVEKVNEKNELAKLKPSAPELIDCRIPLNKEDKDALQRALGCYETYKEVIDRSGVRDAFGDYLSFEIYGENFDPPLDDLTIQLNDQ